MNKIDKHYVSDTDKFLVEYDKKHPEKSASQQAEIKKFGQLNQSRDNVEKVSKRKPIWEEF